MVQEDDLLEIRREIERISDRVDDVRNMEALLVRSNPQAVDEVMRLFDGKGGATLASLYLAVDGKRSVNEIAAEAGVHRVTASKQLGKLHTFALIEAHDVGGTKVYNKSILESALHVTRRLRQRGLAS